MNKILTDQIVKHIFANLSVIPSSFIDLKKTKSLMSKDCLIAETLSFDFGNEVINNKVWACQFSHENQLIKLILGDCTVGQIKEYCLIVSMHNSPSYALYLDTELPNEALIACTMDGKEWLECHTFLQATFLAGMEQIKELGLPWDKCSDYAEQYNMMKSFINYHDDLYDNGKQESISDEG